MKLELNLDLEPLRSSALSKIDAIAAETIAPKITLGPLYAAKIRHAYDVVQNNGVAPQELVDEAKGRGLDTLALCNLILDKDAELHTELMRIESCRQTAKFQISSALGQRDIDIAVATLIGQING